MTKAEEKDPGEPLLKVRDLALGFESEGDWLTAVDGISLEVKKGQSMGLVGESGCGKSVTALAIMRLLPKPMGKVFSGSIHFGSRSLLELSPEEMQEIRGNQIGMIFQEPMTALNPVKKIGAQLSEVFLLHKKVSKEEAFECSIKMLAKVGIPSPETRVLEYPHQLSGGMRQRVVIAMALACSPELIIADEPTTALDVTVQAQILNLLSELQDDMGSAVMLITHDLGVIAETCDEVCVMYAGRIVERAPVGELFRSPRHAYTKGLLNSIPRLEGTPKTKLDTIDGMVPSLAELRPGCRFAPRSGRKHSPELLENRSQYKEVSAGHWVEACPICTDS